MKKFRWPMLAVAVLLPATSAAPLDASTRNYLTVEGRVSDHLGTPLPGTWVFCLGSRRASVPVDSLGHYRLEIPGATLEELERATLKIRIQARRKGYRFALSNGAPELGLEMRVVKDDSPLSRLRVRSNDSATVAAVANSVVLDANPRALVSAIFVGSQGAQYDTPPVPLDDADEITLAGDSQSIPELAMAEPTPVAPGATPSPVRTAEPKPGAAAQSAPSGSKPGTAAAQAVPPPPKPQATVPGPPGVPTPNPQATARASSPPTHAKPPPNASPAETPASAEPRKWNAAGSDREPVKPPHVVRPALDPDPAERGKKPSAGDVAAQARSNPESPAVVVPPPQRITPARTQATHQTQTAPSLSASVRRSSDSTATPHARATTQPEDDPNLRPVLRRDMPVSMVSPGRQPPVRTVPSAPGSSPSSPRRAPISGPSSPPPMCDCMIRGTVEVQWDRPLTSRTEVVIAVEDAPDATTSAELFMGSPRSFEIRPAPCGVHRLLLWTRSRQRFVLVSSEPRVVCTPGGVQQMRLVMEPVARWGATQ